MVADVVNHFWEQQRYRRSTGAIINSARCLALQKILREAIGFNRSDAAAVADIYFGVVRYEEARELNSHPAELPGHALKSSNC